jgi:hypothetical protein
VFIGASNELGAFESGVASTLLGVGPAVVLGGALTILVVGLWVVIFPDLRDIDSFADVAETTVPEPLAAAQPSECSPMEHEPP